MMYIARWILTVGISLVAAWLLGLMVFLAQVQLLSVPVQPKADGIVVLTGGGGRVAVGLQLLADMRGSALLISGVHSDATKDSIIKTQPITDATQRHLLQCCTDLGYAADSTAGNADESAAWARLKKLNSLIVVSAAYHIPRTRLEFTQAFQEAGLPNVGLQYYPLARDNVKLERWWQAPIDFMQRFPGTVRLMVREFNKYLFALGRAAMRYVR
jgi:uncharacterized SAM-binding protein YcdF (DUF218 family)